MASNPVVNTLTFTGSVAGQASIQAQGIAGGLTFLLPNTAPIQGQLLDVQAINGNNVFLGWASQQSLSNIALSALSPTGASNGDVIQLVGGAWTFSAFVPGAGTVTSVAFTTPAELSIAGSPITTSGTLALSWASGTGSGGQGKIIATPSGGGAGAYAGRLLVAGDIPALPYLSNTTVVPNNRPAASHNFLTAYDNTTGNFSIAQPSVADVSGAAPLASPTFTGTVTAGAIAAASGGLAITSSSTDGIRIADSGNVRGILVGGTTAGAGHIWLWSPGGTSLVDVSDTGIAVTGSFTAPTASPLTNSTIVATTAYADAAVAVETSARTAAVALKAPLASPTFTGTVTAPNIAGVNQIAALGGSGLDITATTDLIQIQANGNATINVHGDSTAGVVISNNAGGNSIAVPDSGGIQISTGNSQNLTLNASGAAIIANQSLVVEAKLDLSDGNAHIVPNGDNAGTITVSANTTATHNFAVAYANPPVVVITPTSDPTATGTYWVTSLAGSFTVNVSVSGTITFNYTVMGT